MAPGVRSRFLIGGQSSLLSMVRLVDWALGGIVGATAATAVAMVLAYPALRIVRARQQRFFGQSKLHFPTIAVSTIAFAETDDLRFDRQVVSINEVEASMAITNALTAGRLTVWIQALAPSLSRAPSQSIIAIEGAPREWTRGSDALPVPLVAIGGPINNSYPRTIVAVGPQPTSAHVRYLGDPASESESRFELLVSGGWTQLSRYGDDSWGIVIRYTIGASAAVVIAGLTAMDSRAAALYLADHLSQVERKWRRSGNPSRWVLAVRTRNGAAHSPQEFSLDA